MGVEFFPCDGCSETICDAGHYIRCECGNTWCSDKCAELDGYLDLSGDEKLNRSCNYCSRKDVKDYLLLDFLLKHFEITKNKAKDLYFKYSEK